MTTSCTHESGTQDNSEFTPLVGTNGREVVVNLEASATAWDIGGGFAPLCATDRDAVCAGALGVADLEVGEDGLRADVRQRKSLFASEPAAEFALPRLERHLGRLAAV
jgi:hypothetical protein